VGACTLTATLEFYDNTSTVWVAYNAGTHPFVSAFDAATGVLKVDYSTVATYDPTTASATTINTRITVTDTRSDEAGASLVDEFPLTLKDPCADDALTHTTNLADFTYFINSGASSNLVPVVT